MEDARLFWPASVSRRHATDDSFLIGWNIRNLISCVCLVVPQRHIDSFHENLLSPLSALSQCAEYADLWRQCGGPPHVIGTLSRHGNGTARHERDIQHWKQQATFWVSLNGEACVELSLCGLAIPTTMRFVLYEQPTGFHYYSLGPFTQETHTQAKKKGKKKKRAPTLTTTDVEVTTREEPTTPTTTTTTTTTPATTVSTTKTTTTTTPPATTPATTVATMLQGPKQRNVNNLAQGKGGMVSNALSLRDLLSPSHATKANSKHTDLSVALMQMNNAAQVATLVEQHLSHRPPVTTVVPSRSAAVLWRALGYLVQPIHVGHLLFRTALDSMAYMLSFFLAYSAFATQFHRRANEVSSLPLLWLPTQRKWKNDARGHSHYIAFWSLICQLAVDVCVGVLMGSFGGEYMQRFINGLHRYSHDSLQYQVRWLMDNPAGLKLNVRLAERLGSSVLACLGAWDAVVDVVMSHGFESWVLSAMFVTGFGGASMMLALGADLLAVFTLHVDTLHSMFTKLYGFLLSCLASTWYLFQGKKRNVLRNRIDTCVYELDQLLLGTLMFTVIFFLFPTVTTYYAFFSVVRFLVTASQSAVWICMACLNHLPFFPLFLYMADQQSLPGGIRFEPTPRTATLTMRSTPIKFSLLFSSLKDVLQSGLETYTPSQIVQTLVTGQTFSKFHFSHQLRPTPSIFGLWRFLQQYLTPHN